MHYAGDIHQPLHAESRVNPEYPAGDRGGNSFHVPSIDGAWNLHAVYDSVFYTQSGYPTLPMPTSEWNEFGSQASTYMGQHPESSYSNSHDLVYADWA